MMKLKKEKKKNSSLSCMEVGVAVVESFGREII